MLPEAKPKFTTYKSSVTTVFDLLLITNRLNHIKNPFFLNYKPAVKLQNLKPTACIFKYAAD